MIDNLSRFPSLQAPLLESCSPFAAMWQAAPIGIYLVDEKLKIIQTNQKVALMLELTEEFAGKDLRELISLFYPDDYTEQLVARFRHTLVSGEPYTAEEKVTNRHSGKHLGYFEWQIQRLPLSDGQWGVVCYFNDITKHVLARKALYDSEERFRALAAASSEVVYRMSSDWQEMRHLQGREFIADTEKPSYGWLSKYIHPDDQVQVMAAIAEAVSSKSIFELEHRVLRVDGGLGWVFSRAIPLFDAEGEIVEWFGMASDVTRRKLAEEAVRERELKLRFIMDSVPQKIFTATPDGDVDYFNPIWTEFTGLAFEKIKGWGWLQFIHPEDVEENIRVWKHSVATGELFQLEHRFRRADGAYCWHISRAVPMRDDFGQIIMWIGANTEVHELKMAKEELAKLTVASEQRRRLYETILTSTPDLIYVFDLNHRFTYANKALLEMWGLSWEEANGKTCLELGYPDWHAAMHDREIEEVKATKQAIRGDVPFDGCLGRRIYDYIFVPVLGADNEVEAIAGTTRDITERKLLEDGLRQSACDMAEADRRKDDFLAMLAHELRNPLAPIRTGLDLMRLVEDDAVMSKKIRVTMEGQVRLLVRLVDDLLDISRINRDKITLRKERVALVPIIQSSLEATALLIKESGHELKVICPEETIFLEVDPARLTQIISNLLSNAAKFTNKGGKISLLVEQTSDEVLIKVTDSGIGIPSHMLDSIFEMFTQVDRSMERAHGGLGIGLTLVKRLVEMHGGFVEASSPGLGQGSVFTIHLPRVGRQEERMQTHSEPLKEAKLDSRRILVVDDNKDAALLMSLLLKKLGGNVRIAHDGAEAIAVVKEFCPDIVLMDLGMPKMNGYEAARYLRSQEWAKGVYLVALTGWGQEEDKRRTREAGFDQHVVKPVDLAALQRLLASHQDEKTGESRLH